VAPLLASLGDISANSYGFGAYQPILGNFYSIATATVDSGGASSITFTSIPQTYTHLQIRATTNGTGTSGLYLICSINTDTGTNYNWHYLNSNGASVSAGNSSSFAGFVINDMGGGSSNSNNFGSGIADILDYTNTNKYKTIKTLSGIDNNGSGYLDFDSNLWRNTAAITSITIVYGSNNYAQFSQIALYGVK